MIPYESGQVTFEEVEQFVAEKYERK